MRAFAARVVVIAVAFAARPAMADDVQRADALFERAVRDMRAGRFDSACTDIEQSLGLARRAGVLFTLAECLSLQGKLASAVRRYDEFLDFVDQLSPEQKKRQEERIAVARQQKRELEPRVPRLTLTLPADAPADTKVELDGATLEARAIGLSLPVDPGEHRMVVKNERGSAELAVSLAAGEMRTVELPLPKTPAPPAARAKTESSPATPARAPTLDESEANGTEWTVVAFGVGAAGLALGATLGIFAYRDKQTVDDECEGRVCSESGKEAGDRGRTLALASDIALAVGVAGIGSGVVLLLTRSNEGQRRTGRASAWASVAPVSGGALLAGGGHF